MYSKIAIKNVRKSFKDYTIYFLTLTLAVCIFYSFNSIEAQEALVEMKSSGQESVEMLTNIISYISIFVAIILGSLILYANNFLIKKRNKELGIYMTLGMGKAKISKILILETIIVGVISLIVGLILGLLASQGLSILVSKLFEFGMSEYTFVVSTSAIGQTILCFGIMFILVMLFNTYVISKYKIIDLLTVGRKTEQIKFKSPFVYLITFILCVISLGVGYKFVLDVGLDFSDPKFKISILLGIIGTILFFFSLTGFILYIVKKNKRIYFKGLNIFTVKQINSKVNTNFISMSIISLMLFITIVVLSTGFSFKTALESGLKDSTPFDASAYMFINPDDKVKSMEEALNNANITFEESDKVVYFDEYRNGVNIIDVIPLGDDAKKLNYDISFVKASEYNKIRELNNEEKIDLKDAEVLITSTFSKMLPYVEKYMKENNTIKIKDQTFKIKNEEVLKDNLKTDFMQNNFLTIIINDEFCDNGEVFSSNLNVNFSADNSIEKQKELDEVFRKTYRESDFDYDSIGFVISASRNQIYDETKGMTTTILFVGIYLGIVFLISSMAVLALQQLSEASESIDRYVSLKKLGVNNKGINKTIFTQTLIYFSLPVILAFIHSVVGIRVTSDFVAMYNKPDIGASSLITAGIFIIIYMIYFYTTYTGYKNIVRAKIK